MNPTIGMLFTIHIWLDEENFPEWPGPRHKVLYLEAHEDAWESPASNAEKLHAAKWRVGVLSRVALRLLRELLDQNVAVEHRCTSRYGREREEGEFCGGLYAYDLINQPRTVEGDPGYVGVIVPAEQAERWADRARHLVNRVITTDAAPPPPEPERDHEQPHFTDPSMPTRKAST